MQTWKLKEIILTYLLKLELLVKDMKIILILITLDDLECLTKQGLRGRSHRLVYSAFQNYAELHWTISQPQIHVMQKLR